MFAFILFFCFLNSIAQNAGRKPVVSYVVTEIVDNNSSGVGSKLGGLGIDIKSECDKQGKIGFELTSVLPSKKTIFSPQGNLEEQSIYILIFKKTGSTIEKDLPKKNNKISLKNK